MTPDVQWAEMTSISENADIGIQMICNDISKPAYPYWLSMIDHARKILAFRSVDRSQIDDKWKIFDEEDPEPTRQSLRLPVTPTPFPRTKRSITAPDMCTYHSTLASIFL